MIRRNHPLAPNANAESWWLVSQVEHARLSHRLAAAWDQDALFGGLLTGGMRDEALLAILHHDDGWAEWERAPRIDPQRGRPYAYTEMPAADAQRIWDASIDVCRAIGPVAGASVAGHFVALQEDHDHDYDAWRGWIDATRDRRRQWLGDSGGAAAPGAAALALRLLQAFDWLSLWFCCVCPATAGDAPAEPLVFDSGRGVTRFRPGPGPGAEGAWHVAVTPWPFVAPEVELRVAAASAPAGQYADAAALAAASRPVTLAWRLAPGDDRAARS